MGIFLLYLFSFKKSSIVYQFTVIWPHCQDPCFIFLHALISCQIACFYCSKSLLFIISSKATGFSHLNVGVFLMNMAFCVDIMVVLTLYLLNFPAIITHFLCLFQCFFFLTSALWFSLSLLLTCVSILSYPLYAFATTSRTSSCVVFLAV